MLWQPSRRRAQLRFHEGRLLTCRPRRRGAAGTAAAAAARRRPLAAVGRGVLRPVRVAAVAVDARARDAADRARAAATDTALVTEVKLMAALEHENIVRYLGAEEDVSNGDLYIFQEWVAGGAPVG